MTVTRDKSFAWPRPAPLGTLLITNCAVRQKIVPTRPISTTGVGGGALGQHPKDVTTPPSQEVQHPKNLLERGTHCYETQQHCARTFPPEILVLMCACLGQCIITVVKREGPPHLQSNDSEEDSTSHIHVFPTQHHGAAAELAQQVCEDEESRDEPAAAPGRVDVVALFPPLEPHADAILQERADQTQTSDVRQHVLTMPQNLKDTCTIRSVLICGGFAKLG